MDPERAADLLAQERARVENSLASLELDAAQDARDSAEDAVPEDRAADLTRFETDQALAARLSRELELIDAADARLREGTYGISVVSGDQIPDERLEAIPWADRTVEEESAA
ncbi:MAG: molecular chaperone DnaK [Actinomycetes bacterium]